MLKSAIDFNLKILKIAMNLGETQIMVAIATSYKITVSKKMLIKAIKDG